MVEQFLHDFVHLVNKFDDSIEVMMQNHLIMTLEKKKYSEENLIIFNNIPDVEVMLIIHPGVE